jgi:hypothetical protein
VLPQHLAVQRIGVVAQQPGRLGVDMQEPPGAVHHDHPVADVREDAPGALSQPPRQRPFPSPAAAVEGILSGVPAAPLPGRRP